MQGNGSCEAPVKAAESWQQKKAKENKPPETGPGQPIPAATEVAWA